MKRTSLLALSAALALALVAGLAAPAAAQTKRKIVLNWKFQGPQGIFFLPEDRGYYKAEGLELTIDQGNGSGAAVPLVANGTYDVGFGDINALIELAGRKPEDAPIAVYVIYNQPPFTAAVKTESPIKSPKDFEGRTLGGATGDGALKLFPALRQDRLHEGEHHQHAAEPARANADAGPGRRRIRLCQYHPLLRETHRRGRKADTLYQLRKLRNGSLFQCNHRLEEAGQGQAGSGAGSAAGDQQRDCRHPQGSRCSGCERCQTRAADQNPGGARTSRCHLPRGDESCGNRADRPW